MRVLGLRVGALLWYDTLKIAVRTVTHGYNRRVDITPLPHPTQRIPPRAEEVAAPTAVSPRCHSGDGLIEPICT